MDQNAQTKVGKILEHRYDCEPLKAQAKEMECHGLENLHFNNTVDGSSITASNSSTNVHKIS